MLVSIFDFVFHYSVPTAARCHDEDVLGPRMPSPLHGQVGWEKLGIFIPPSSFFLQSYDTAISDRQPRRVFVVLVGILHRQGNAPTQHLSWWSKSLLEAAECPSVPGRGSKEIIQF